MLGLSRFSVSRGVVASSRFKVLAKGGIVKQQLQRRQQEHVLVGGFSRHRYLSDTRTLTVLQRTKALNLQQQFDNENILLLCRSFATTSSQSSTAEGTIPPPPPPPSPTSSSTSSSPPPLASIRLPSTKTPPNVGKPPMPRKIGRVAIPTPEKALPPEAKPGGWKKKLDAKKIAFQTWQITRTVIVTLATYAYKAPYWTWYYATHAQERKDAITKLKELAQHEAQHYWNGTKLLVADVRTARGLLLKTLNGNALTRREKKQLLRTVSDLFRLVPFSMFIIIPFMEFALPFALRIFPNLLPSTFQDSLKAEESMKRELQSRIAMAQFFQETLETLAAEQKKKAVKQRQELEQQNAHEHDADTPDSDTPQADPNIYKQEDSAASMLEFLAKARNGEMIPPDVIIRYANYFQDDLTLDNMPRMQLINMCRYMNIPPYGSDSFLRFQLRHKIRSLKEDDQKILWEGIESLTKMELREAVQERGMRSTGLSKDAYKRALQQWLDLSVNKNVPIALLIMSRTFFLNEEIPPMPATHKEDTAKKDTAAAAQAHAALPDAKKKRLTTDKKTDHTGTTKTETTAVGGSGGTASPETATDTSSDNSLTGLADAISGLDNQVLNEVILNMATTEEKTSDPEIRKLKLEVLQKQNELIRKEQQDYEDAKKQQQQVAAAKAAAAAEVLETSQVAAETSTEAAQGDKSTTPPEGVEGMGDSTTKAPPSNSTPSPTAASGDGHLTTEEMDALRTILTDDPVSSEREALEQIKAAMKGDMKPDQREELQRIRESIESHVSDSTNGAKIETNLPPRATTSSPMTPEEADAYAADQIREQDSVSASAMEHSTSWASGDGEKSPGPSAAQDEVSNDDIVPDEHGEEEPEDPIVARLKRRVESMVDKIELQLSETQVKIGDKMHLLDKDSDGILTREEVAEVLGQVFKKNITFEEAMEIANEMDDNQDGIFTVDELLRWIDQHRLVRFVAEGRDVDLDKLIESHPSSDSKENSETPPQK